ncbi:hypothetical protein N7510_001179 [Penicillium lagena]|uniref:uncharacterized protein n=1 Tax=Penicillium lagena TaxID=94218 RepID=UPI0025413F18|nr:uncharacterized protein N7510_001179 [Penicillium lagena]KAJ5624870.1 hypothetical protein N7510_001179 [Penicillium lagena]
MLSPPSSSLLSRAVVSPSTEESPYSSAGLGHANNYAPPEPQVPPYVSRQARTWGSASVSTHEGPCHRLCTTNRFEGSRPFSVEPVRRVLRISKARHRPGPLPRPGEPVEPFLFVCGLFEAMFNTLCCVFGQWCDQCGQAGLFSTKSSLCPQGVQLEVTTGQEGLVNACLCYRCAVTALPLQPAGLVDRLSWELNIRAWACLEARAYAGSIKCLLTSQGRVRKSPPSASHFAQFTKWCFNSAEAVGVTGLRLPSPPAFLPITTNTSARDSSSSACLTLTTNSRQQRRLTPALVTLHSAIDRLGCPIGVYWATAGYLSLPDYTATVAGTDVMGPMCAASYYLFKQYLFKQYVGRTTGLPASSARIWWNLATQSDSIGWLEWGLKSTWPLSADLDCEGGLEWMVWRVYSTVLYEWFNRGGRRRQLVCSPGQVGKFAFDFTRALDFGDTDICVSSYLHRFSHAPSALTCQCDACETGRTSVAGMCVFTGGYSYEAITHPGLWASVERHASHIVDASPLHLKPLVQAAIDHTASRFRITAQKLP